MERMEMIQAERGCGDAVGGKLYLHMGVGPGGIPLEEFGRDPILPVSDLDIKKRGMTLIEKYGTYHIFDYIGENAYPNVMDWWEEVRRLGLHVRTEANLDFKKLDKYRSMYIPVHPRAYISRSDDVTKVMQARRDVHQGHHNCHFNVDGHDDWWSGALSFEDGVPPRCFDTLHMNIIRGQALEAEKQVVRTMPSFSYHDYSFFPRMKHELGAFAAFPISMLDAVIYEGEGFDDTVEMSEKHGIKDMFNVYEGVLTEEYADYENQTEWEEVYEDAEAN